jgi:hypothetical protein
MQGSSSTINKVLCETNRGSALKRSHRLVKTKEAEAQRVL